MSLLFEFINACLLLYHAYMENTRDNTIQIRRTIYTYTTDAHKGRPYYIWHAPHSRTSYSRVAPCGRLWVPKSNLIVRI